MQVLLHSPEYVHKLERGLLVGPSESTEEMAAVAALVEFIDS
jgi:hypothetical protein